MNVRIANNSVEKTGVSGLGRFGAVLRDPFVAHRADFRVIRLAASANKRHRA